MKMPDLFYKIAGIVHCQKPDSIVIKIDAEFRDDESHNEHYSDIYGIDLDRYIVFHNNKPEDVLLEIKKTGIELALIGIERRLGIEIVKGV